MKKYDCSKTLDYVHEMSRLCNSIPVVGGTCDNSNCPLGHITICSYPTQEHIDILQKWSDEHPEKPKLTKREYEFLITFLISMDKYIGREPMYDLYIHDARCDTYYGIDPTMFSFIQEGEQMTFDELLKLEVEEETIEINNGGK